MNRGNEHNLREALEAMLKAYKLKEGYTEARIRLLWQEQMGHAISQHTTECRLYKGKLFIAVTAAPLRQELAMSRQTLRDRLNEALGEPAIEELIIR